MPDIDYEKQNLIFVIGYLKHSNVMATYKKKHVNKQLF